MTLTRFLSLALLAILCAHAESQKDRDIAEALRELKAQSARLDAQSRQAVEDARLAQSRIEASIKRLESTVIRQNGASVQSAQDAKSAASGDAGNLADINQGGIDQATDDARRQRQETREQITNQSQSGLYNALATAFGSLMLFVTALLGFVLTNHFAVQRDDRARERQDHMEGKVDQIKVLVDGRLTKSMEGQLVFMKAFLSSLKREHAKAPNPESAAVILDLEKEIVQQESDVDRQAAAVASLPKEGSS